MACCSREFSSVVVNNDHQVPFGNESLGAAVCHGPCTLHCCGICAVGFWYFGPTSQPVGDQQRRQCGKRATPKASRLPSRLRLRRNLHLLAVFQGIGRVQYDLDRSR